MNQLFTQLSQLFFQYSMKQRLIVSGVLIAFLSAVIVLVMWSNRTEYELLLGNLSPESANSIISDMRNSKIPFRLENGGTAIYVAADHADELRLKYAQSGYMKDSVSGYELFDNNSMGMTTFMQQLNFKRAQEGELMRTINQFPEVKMCRVHLVIPEDKLFEGQQKGSASVVLHFRRGASLNQSQIKGVASLVANSVEGINPEDVVVMDDEGNILIEGKDDDPLLAGVGNQLELQQALENKLQKKIKAIVGGVVGNSNTVVKVSAELNFDRIERVKDDVDPETSALVSEDTYSENSNNVPDTSKYNAQKVVRNYEFSKSHETYVSNSGNVKRLSVAVLVNGRYNRSKNADGEITAVYEPRSSEELDQIAALVKSAVGYNEDRGDKVEVQNIKLAAQPMMPDTGVLSGGFPIDLIEKLLTYLLIAIGLFMAYRLLTGLLKTSISQLGVPALAGINQHSFAEPDSESSGGTIEAGKKHTALPKEEELSDDLFMKKLSPEARAKMKANDRMTQEVIDFVEESPDNASKLLRSWITQAGAK